MMDVAHIAAICHDANRRLQIVTGDRVVSHSWDHASDAEVESATLGVQNILDGKIDGPRASHESWAAQKIADGWKWGEVKDPAAKTHPCLIAYDSLPPEQRAKDALFVAIVTALDTGARKG